MAQTQHAAARHLPCLVAILAAAVATATRCPAADDGPYDLKSGRQVGDTHRVDCQLQVGGDLRMATDGKTDRTAMSVVANIRYDEKLLDVDPGPKGRLQSVRYLDQAEAVVKVEGRTLKPSVRDPMRLVMVRSEDGQTLMFSPRGPLTREELDLMDIPGNSLLVGRLLPGRPMAVGQTWRHSAAVVTALLGLDAVSQCELESVLVEVTDKMAKIALAGIVQGAVDGAATELEVKGVYLFNRQRRRITRLELAIKEKRSVGHVGPGLDIVAKINMRITPTDDTPRLAAAEDRPDQVGLLYESQQGGFRMTYDRRWYVTADEPRLAVLRLVDQGELIAQCRLSPVASKLPSRHITLRQYQKDIRYSLGDHFGQFVQATEWRHGPGSQIFRVRVSGQVEKLPVEWRYYLIAHESGRRVALAFTVEGNLAKRLGDADRALVGSIAFVSPAADARLETATQATAGSR